MLTEECRNEIFESINKLFRGEIINNILYGILILATIVCFFVNYKNFHKNTKTLVGFIIIVILAVMLITMKFVEFVPIYSDYKYKDFTICENAKIYIEIGQSNMLEKRHTVIVKTKNGEFKLKFVNDSILETETVYFGTIAYTNCSKHIVWYDLNTLN